MVAGHRIGYIPVFSWTSDDAQVEIVNAIVELNKQGADSWVLDLRDGFRGANPEFASIFSRDIVSLQTIGRDGVVALRDTQMRGPIVLLTNGGTRSGKEVIAYGAKRSKAATIIGEQTAGAVLAGQLFFLSDGSLLYLAVADVAVDGERLEGRGVTPDLLVPFDLRYSMGDDIQLKAALRYLGDGR